MYSLPQFDNWANPRFVIAMVTVFALGFLCIVAGFVRRRRFALPELFWLATFVTLFFGFAIWIRHNPLMPIPSEPGEYARPGEVPTIGP